MVWLPNLGERRAAGKRCGLRVCGPPIRKAAVPSIQFLGTGPGFPVPGRFFTSSLLRGPDARVLVDAGEPCSLTLHSEGVSASSLDAVLITHGHSDHTAGLPMLLQSAWLEKRRKPLPVYLPVELVAPLEGWLDAVYLPPPLLGFPLEFRPWRTGFEEVVAPGIAVTPFPSTHLQGLRELIEPAASDRFKAFGLVFDCDGRRAVVSSDLGAPQDLEAALARPCDLLVCEFAHFAPADLFAFLHGREIGELVLTHLARELAGGEADVAAAARSALPHIKKIRIVSDGEIVDF